jgi:chemotaxis protein MotB
MADDKSERPIIIIKKKKGGHAHHGGAWKVAFADFMTAMFALFLVLWILTQSQEVKEAVASYFRHATDYEGKPDTFLRGNEGLMDFKQGRMDNNPESIDTEKPKGNAPPGDGGKEKGEPSASVSGGQGKLIASDSKRPQAEVKDREMDETKDFLALHDKIMATLNSTASFNRVQDNLMIQVLEEGLLIQVMELEKSPLFETGQDVFRLGIRSSLEAIAAELSKLPNKLEIDGHGTSITNSYSEKKKWMASVAIADLARAQMEKGGLKPQQVSRVSGCADRRPLEGAARRITIFVRPRQWVDRY